MEWYEWLALILFVLVEVISTFCILAFFYYETKSKKLQAETLEVLNCRAQAKTKFMNVVSDILGKECK